MKKTLLHASFAILCLALLLVSYSWAQGTMALRVNGAAMASDQVALWAKSFHAENPNMNVLVVGSSAGKGFESLFEKRAEIGLASRLISPEEMKTAESKNMKLANRLIGYAGMAVYTSPENPVNELTMEQLRKIFTGDFTNWKDVGGPDQPIRCFTRRVPESGGAVFFQNTVLKKAPYAPSTIKAESWGSIIKICANAKDLPIGIGPVPINGTSGGAKVLGVKADENSPAVIPSEETLKNKTYPILLPFYMYWDADTKDKRVMDFVNYCEQRGIH
ncbi:substrate-binding domain-containing protein [Desulfomonile tiedjei]|uniref:Phosphate ABC transporter substrate-binding protein, PhoT family n=1 Tax=Desulfomonile tiedjei (strain ATCC 49306 / DSM 6799 / DCB-1) TaxID=706587 RepID=I4C7C5_DESTA|nr:substrate-binding domain-containing protein [Desulfomonile tiedjei]AFM25466.1 phosphate ABC transporter substrate-binding protein, PhoT family [Desulfomonile tiedjei DSM 6799]